MNLLLASVSGGGRLESPTGLFGSPWGFFGPSPVNDAPSFTLPGNPPTVNEDAGSQSVNNFVTNFRPGPAAATDESTQTPTYVLKMMQSTGTLAFTVRNSGVRAISATGMTSLAL